MSDTERRMDAYYYGFMPTGVDVIDKVLSAVAWAGTAYHHTESWGEDAGPYDDHASKTPVDWIQNAAVEAAAEIERLQWLASEQAKDIVMLGQLAGRGVELEARIATLETALREATPKFIDADLGGDCEYERCRDAYSDCSGELDRIKQLIADARAALEEK